MMSFFLDMSCRHVTADGRGVLAQAPPRNLTHGHHPNGAGRDDEFVVHVSTRFPAHTSFLCTTPRLTGVGCWHRSLKENSLTATIPTVLAELTSLYNL